MAVDCTGETRSGARSPTGKVTDVKQHMRIDAANTAATVTNNHLVVHGPYYYYRHFLK